MLSFVMPARLELMILWVVWLEAYGAEAVSAGSGRTWTGFYGAYPRYACAVRFWYLMAVWMEAYGIEAVSAGSGKKMDMIF